MFKVKHIRTGEIRTVYGWVNTMFLFYDQEDGWIYKPMINYRPLKEG